MSIRIVPYIDEFSESVQEFNQRLAPARVTFKIPAEPASVWLPKRSGRSIHREIFLALEERRVRGAYTLKTQEFLCGGAVHTVGSCQMPISEGIVDRRYALVGLKIMQDALRRQPLAYDLGIGSFDASIARVHRAMGWDFRAVPFYFRVANGFEFARNIQFLRTNCVRRLALDMAAFSGISSVAAWLARGWYGNVHQARSGMRRVRPGAGGVFAESFTEFGRWADDIWQQCRDHYSMAALRDSDVLNILYPPDNERFIRIKVLRHERAIGWAILLNTRMRQSKHFGNMRVGSIVDCLSSPGEESAVISETARILEQGGVDLMVTNQSHWAWRDACGAAGFMPGPSNYIFGVSKEFFGLLRQTDPGGERIHITRGDGDGPIHL